MSANVIPFPIERARKPGAPVVNLWKRPCPKCGMPREAGHAFGCPEAR